jgi:hypothetical protein
MLRPSGISPVASSSTWTNRRSVARRSISSAARAGFWGATTIEARSRGSRSSHCLTSQSLTAAAIAAAMCSSMISWTP